MQIFNVQW